MINSEEFAKRLRLVLDYYQLSAAAFAERISVQRSSISHLLSGRNKPSLDFVLKVLHEFKEVELYWLLNGKGTFPNTTDEIGNSITPTLFQDAQETDNEVPDHTTAVENKSPNDSKTNEVIDRIVIFYKSGKFKEYKN